MERAAIRRIGSGGSTALLLLSAACYSPSLQQEVAPIGAGGQGPGAPPPREPGDAAVELPAPVVLVRPVEEKPSDSLQPSLCGTEVCPSIRSLRLPAPCLGLEYATQLSAAPGLASDYTWSLASEPPGGLTLTAQGLLSGVPRANGKVSVVATNSAGQQARAELDLSARRSCWLAYLDEGEGASPVRLHFRDVFGRQRDIPLPAGDAAAGVLDFEFAPDGKWIAFRVGPPEQAGLHLFPIAEEPWAAEQHLESQSLDLRCGSAGEPCSVRAFSWSKDSRRLAVILHHAGENRDYLSGLDLEAPEALWVSLGVDQLLGANVQFATGLTWFGEQRVAFLGQSPLSASEQALYHARLSSSGRSFEELTLVPTVVGTSLVLRDSPPGLVVLDPAADTRYVDVENNAIHYHTGAWLSPSGRFFARTTDGARLEIYAREDEEAPLLTLDNAECGTIVAWSEEHEQRESIACSAARQAADGKPEPTGEGLMLVDLLVSPEPRFVEPSRVLETADYSEGPMAGVRRMFSRDASWLIIAAPVYDALIVDRHQPSPRPLFAGIPIDADAEAEISPDGTALLVYGDFVTAFPLPRRPARSLSTRADGSSIPTPADRFGCQELAQLLPERWCGMPRLPAHFRWSPDSQSTLFEAADGGLWVSEVTPADTEALTDTAPRQLAVRLPRPPPGNASRAYAYRP